MNLSQRMKMLEAKKSELETRLISAAEAATKKAVEKAADLTPPTQNDLRGTNTRTGEMKQHWATDSKTTPVRMGNKIVTELNNDREYASYVNDGHRLDRHFVPGLYINQQSGLLEYAPGMNVGIVVGTKTSYVPGLYMVEKAREEYSKVVKSELKDVGDIFK